MEVQIKHRPIDFSKIDKKRPEELNDEILELFNNFINTSGIDKILSFYKSQDYLLCINKINNKLIFYGCNEDIEHHSSNIEYIVKFLLHKMLHDNGSKKILLDKQTMSLVAFGFLPLMRMDQTGNVYQGFDNRPQCNVKAFKVCLSNQQIELAKKILKLI